VGTDNFRSLSTSPEPPARGCCHWEQVMGTVADYEEALRHLAEVPPGRRLPVWYVKVDEYLDARMLALLDAELEESACP
jgi:hypothetical protein